MAVIPSADDLPRANRRTGRRPGGTGTRQDILVAARRIFAERGYSGATMRAIAHEAKVDAALVHHFFGSKDGVFNAAVQATVDPAELLPPVIEPGIDGLGPRLLRMFLWLWSAPETRDSMLAVMRSAVAHPEAARLLREFMLENVLAPIAGEIDKPDADLRMTMVSSHLVGLAMLRFVIKVEPIASTDEDELVRVLGPVLQHYLQGDI